MLWRSCGKPENRGLAKMLGFGVFKASLLNTEFF
jgi:hypothetical protein